MLDILRKASRPASIVQTCRPFRASVVPAKWLSKSCSRCAIVTRAQTPDSSQQQQASALPAVASAPVTDQAVPEGHQSLHNFLYSSGDAEHTTHTYEFRKGEDDGSTILPVGPFLDSRDGERPLGVYALYDEDHNLQYVGYSRNIVLAVKAHLSRVGESRCAFIRPMVFANKAMATRAHMEQQAADWLAEAGVVPPGNGVEAHIWEEQQQAVAAAAMSAAEAAAYEEKRLKLRKAMGESLMDDVDVDAAAADRRLALLAAVSGDNWSAVISEQTQATLQAAVAAGGGRLGGRQLSADEAAPHPHHVHARAGSSHLMAAAAAGGGSSGSSGAEGVGSSSSEAAAAGSSGPVVSPFSKASVHRQVGEKHKTAQEGAAAGTVTAAAVPAPPPLTIESVTSALDEVRPYLLADGGDVSVLSVEGGVVAVELQGACSSCASSSATLKMGIERQLKAVFGDAVSEVVQVDLGGGRPRASVESVDLHLNMLRSAVANLGGAVEVASVGSGVAVLRYRGPAAIGKGLAAAIKDAFPDIKEVVLKDF